MSGGYDEGYRRCPCFWGTSPGSYVKILTRYVRSFDGLKVLDVGCGEGKNAVFLAGLGAVVDAVDVSPAAIENGTRMWGKVSKVCWMVADIRELELSQEYDIVVAYGLCHCLNDSTEVSTVVAKLQAATARGGYNVLCAFNDRGQDLLSAHAGFEPCLLGHSDYLSQYASWTVLAASDSDLTERHPHNGIDHTHSLTRILAKRRHDVG